MRKIYPGLKKTVPAGQPPTHNATPKASKTEPTSNTQRRTPPCQGSKEAIVAKKTPSLPLQTSLALNFQACSDTLRGDNITHTLASSVTDPIRPEHSPLPRERYQEFDHRRKPLLSSPRSPEPSFRSSAGQAVAQEDFRVLEVINEKIGARSF